MIKKVLLVTIFKVPNFGSVLQAYATQKTLENQGFECKVLNYDHNNSDWSVAHGVKKQSGKNKIGRLLGLNAHHRKANKLAKFAAAHLHLTRQYYNIENIEREEYGHYDKYIVGSDQVWNTRFTNGDPVFLLDFVKGNEADCYAISSSFASNAIDTKHKEKFLTGLKKFKQISVREQNGINILNSLGISNASLTLDPTLLLSSNEWNKLIEKERILPKKYILLYMLCYAFDPRPLIFNVLKRYQKELDCPIIALEGYTECKGQTDLDIVDATDSSVSEFLQLFANASLVVTSSFHGTAFALNYGKPLLSITPDNDDDRQRTLLHTLGLEQCISTVAGGKDISYPFYDKDDEQNRLKCIRSNSLNIINQEIIK